MNNNMQWSIGVIKREGALKENAVKGLILLAFYDLYWPIITMTNKYFQPTPSFPFFNNLVDYQQVILKQQRGQKIVLTKIQSNRANFISIMAKTLANGLPSVVWLKRPVAIK